MRRSLDLTELVRREQDLRVGFPTGFGVAAGCVCKESEAERDHEVPVDHEEMLLLANPRLNHGRFSNRLGQFSCD